MNKPKRTDAQIVGDVGEVTAQLIFKKYGWTADIIASDYGEDLSCNIFIDNQRTNLHFRCQVKSSQKESKYIRQLKNGDFSVKIKSTTLSNWLTSLYPTIIIIFDNEKDTLYWENPVKQLLENPDKLSKKTPTIRISKKQKLNNKTKDLIYKEINSFYKKLLRLDRSKTECNIYPLIMPKYKVPPFLELYQSFSSDKEINIDNISIDSLPSWLNVLRKIEPDEHVNTFKYISNINDFKEIILKIKEKLLNEKFLLRENEWLSYVISPITVFPLEVDSWNKELTNWNSYSVINNTIVSDYDYSFEVPSGYFPQKSRRSRSWDYYNYINTEQDLAIQIFSKHEITPAIRKTIESHINNKKSHILLWVCNSCEIKLIEKLLSPLDISLELLEKKGKDVLLLMSTGMINLRVGLYQLSSSWDDYESGAVLNLLNKNNVYHKLPGRKYSGEIPEILSELVGDISSIERNVSITAYDYTNSIPLLHNERMIQIFRLQMLENKAIDRVKCRMKKENKLKFDIDLQLINERQEANIYELSVSWNPDIKHSSKESYELYKEEIVRYFRMLLPTEQGNKYQFKNTLEILKYAGEIDFEEINT